MGQGCRGISDCSNEEALVLLPNQLESARRIFAGCVLFSDLVESESRSLGMRLRLKDFGPGETIFRMGDPGEAIMAVLSGSIKVSVSSMDGKEIILAILHPNDIIGEIAILDGRERTADAVALTETHVAIIDRRDVMAFFDAHPRMWQRIVDVLCRRLRATNEHFADVALLPLSKRLAKALIRLASAGAQGGKSFRDIAMSQTELGKVVNASRETVNKLLSDWRGKGVVSIERGLVKIAEVEALEELAGSREVQS
jgi:CRP/FNR family transcriptional regulator, cyclic AMP receptor protein